MINRRIANKKALTLPELLVASVILSVVMMGILFSYTTCLELNEIAKNSSVAIRAAQTRLDSIRNTSFAQVKSTYNQIPFVTSGLNGSGVSYVDDSNPDLLDITVVVCWRQPNGRTIGEDTDLNGQLDAGEDTNSNGMLDSIAMLKTYIFNRQ